MIYRRIKTLFQWESQPLNSVIPYGFIADPVSNYFILIYHIHGPCHQTKMLYRKKIKTLFQ